MNEEQAHMVMQNFGLHSTQVVELPLAGRWWVRGRVDGVDISCARESIQEAAMFVCHLAMEVHRLMNMASSEFCGLQCTMFSHMLQPTTGN